MARLDAVCDHVAIAVPDADGAERRWVDELGGARLTNGGRASFRSRQLRFTGGGKLELLSPPPDAGPDNFVRRFLARFGAVIHHVTLKVGDLHDAIATVKAAGFDVVDVDDQHPVWQEFFLRPSQVGGIVVQVACSSRTDAQWAAELGQVPGEPKPWAPALLGPRLRHPDLAAARRLWSLLGAAVNGTAEEFVCSWPDSPLTVTVGPGEPAGPVALRMAAAAALPADDELGPAVEPELAVT